MCTSGSPPFGEFLSSTSPCPCLFYRSLRGSPPRFPSLPGYFPKGPRKKVSLFRYLSVRIFCPFSILTGFPPIFTNFLNLNLQFPPPPPLAKWVLSFPLSPPPGPPSFNLPFLSLVPLSFRFRILRGGWLRSGGVEADCSVAFCSPVFALDSFLQ